MPNLFLAKSGFSGYKSAVELQGTTAVITGSSGRLGGAVALALGRAGCNCICHYRSNKQRAEKIVEQIETLGVKALAIAADLTEPDEIEDLFEKAAQIGKPQILINSAAVFSRQPLEEATFEEARRVLDLNLTAPILISRCFAKIMKAKFPNTEPAPAKAGVGKIINIADVGGPRPWAGYALYCSSKAGLIGATKAIAKELAPSICVNAIAPGLVTWPVDFDESERERQLSFVPVRRIARVSEITEAIIFLLKNDYITGQVLNVDGGRCI